MKFIVKKYFDCNKIYCGHVCAMKKRKKQLLSEFKIIYGQLLKIYKRIYKLKVTESDFFYILNLNNSLLNEIIEKIDILNEEVHSHGR